MYKEITSVKKNSIFTLLVNFLNSKKSFLYIFFIVLSLLLIGISLYALNNKQIYKSEAAVTNCFGLNCRIVDLKTYYPNYELIGSHYLYQTSPNQVLWFERKDQYTVRMYNSDPKSSTARCHWDELSWWNDNTFRYSKTHDECPGKPITETIYDPPIIFLPRIWNPRNGNWSLSNQAKVTHSENGVVTCTGLNKYTASIIGWEEIHPKVYGLHWKTEQNTIWDSFGKCNGWEPTLWQEDYWFINNLPVEGKVPSKGLKRTKGGNLKVVSENWDIWFDTWKKLP